MRTTPVHIERTWRHFLSNSHTSRQTIYRDQLIEHYSYLVKITVGRIAPTKPMALDTSDLHGFGYVGLVKAIDQFDATRQVKFETYAITLIRGAILEGLREDDWVPRSVREPLRRMQKKESALIAKNRGFVPSDEELAVECEVDLEDIKRYRMAAVNTNLLSLSAPYADDGSNDGNGQLSLEDALATDATSVFQSAVRSCGSDVLQRMREKLPEREHKVLESYYYTGKTFRDIGADLQVSESRVYQLHTQAITRLRNMMQSQQALFAN